MGMGLDESLGRMGLDGYESTWVWVGSGRVFLGFLVVFFFFVFFLPFFFRAVFIRFHYLLRFKASVIKE